MKQRKRYARNLVAVGTLKSLKLFDNFIRLYPPTDVLRDAIVTREIALRAFLESKGRSIAHRTERYEMPYSAREWEARWRPGWVECWRVSK